MTYPILDYVDQRWKWSSLLSKITSVSFHATLRELMQEDPEIYNWLWSSIAIALQTREHTIEIPLPDHIAALLPEQKITIIRLDDKEIHVMI